MKHAIVANPANATQIRMVTLELRVPAVTLAILRFPRAHFNYGAVVSTIEPGL